ncbi:MAG: alpha/beta fold hydrolase, partial [Pseudomonadota bacterium]
ENQQSLWQQIRVPVLHLQAAQDAIVRSWAETFTPAVTSEVVTVPGMTHWPRGQAVTLCRDEIRQFVFGKGDSWEI